MHIHILGICGTFMGSLAILAKALGHQVSGSDQNVYPPMSTQLEAQGIELMQGYEPAHLQPDPDLVIVGNAMSRGNPAVEYVLNRGLNYISGPQWLREHVLQGRWVIAAAGTHGKTTTSSMVAWILEDCGLKPGYLIGGVPKNFEVSARLGEMPFFVVEADEYDSAFFDKRSKFVHYAPRTAILNNLEFDHADIFDDLAAIQKQFHHLVRTVPQQGLLVMPAGVDALEEVVDQGCWTPQERFSLCVPETDAQSENSTQQVLQAGWVANLLRPEGSSFEVFLNGQLQGSVEWLQTGQHNVANGLAAIAACRHAGVRPEHAIDALNRFEGVKRRMEIVGEVKGVTLYDDFAHHPTAIKLTLEGLRRKCADQRIIAIIEPRSNTMRMGVHKSQLAKSAEDASEVIWYQPEGIDWALDDVVAASPVPAKVMRSIESIIEYVAAEARAGDQIVMMSNGGFGGIHQKLLRALIG